MKIRLHGVGNRGRDFFTSRAFDLSDTLEMKLAIECWKEHKNKYDKFEVVDAETGETPIGDPFEDIAHFYAHVK